MNTRAVFRVLQILAAIAFVLLTLFQLYRSNPLQAGATPPKVEALSSAVVGTVADLRASTLGDGRTAGSVTVHRSGFRAPNDGGGADYLYAPGPCAAPDDGAEVPAASGGCWLIEKGAEYSIRVWGAADGDYDDGPAYRAALAFLGRLGGPRTLKVDVVSSSIHGPPLVVPPLVSVKGVATSPGADQIGVPQINLYDTTSYVYLSGTSALEGVYVAGYGPAGIDHVIELGGGVGLHNLKFSYTVNGILLTRKLTTDKSGVVIPGPAASGLRDGGYADVPFTGGGGSGAALRVEVEGGKVARARITKGGEGYQPFFDFGLAADALYPGSPAVAAVGQISTVNCSRSWIDHVFGIAYGDKTRTGIEIDSTYDYTMLHDIEMWSPGGIQGTTSVAYRFGHIDGGAFSALGAYGFNYGIRWEDPSVSPQSFVSVTGLQFDLVGTGVLITSPLVHLTFDGGFIRTLGKSFNVVSPSLELAITNMVLGGGRDVAVAVSDFDQLNLTGDIFLSPTMSNDFMTVHVGLPGQTMTGTGNYYIGGNTFDGHHPGIVVEAGAKPGTIGPNRWPGRHYPAVLGDGRPSLGYIAPNASTVAVSPVTGGSTDIVADGRGDVEIAWNLGYRSAALSAQLFGGCASAGYRAEITDIDTEKFTLQIHDRLGKPVPSARCSVMWRA